MMAQAVYPVRIGPTFSDANWSSMGGIPGADGVVSATHPGPSFTVDGATENAQNGGRDGVTDSTPVFPGADIQRVMGAIFDAPALTH
jgi:hypothetical protein